MTSKSLRNFTFVLGGLFLSSAGSQAGQTCAQVGLQGIGPGCAQNPEGGSCAECVNYYCGLYADGDEDCATDCFIGGLHWCS